MVLKIDKPLSGNDSAKEPLYLQQARGKGSSTFTHEILLPTFKQSRKIGLLIIQEELPRVLCS